MKLGVIFPQNDIGPDPGAVRDYTVAAEEMGFEYLQIYDHVLGADGEGRPNLVGSYRLQHEFREVMVVLGYMAAVTSRIKLATGVLVLPQRQTALVAKQAAEVDLLSQGRLILGVGTGWNWVEYEALGENFKNRGRRIEEQVEVLRRLWTDLDVTFEGRWHQIERAGINPLPVQRPIPIWMGGNVEAVWERVGRMADGWFPLWRMYGSPEKLREAIDRVHASARAAGRDPQAIAVAGLVTMSQGGPDDWRASAEDWKAAGVTHLAANTMGLGFRTAEEHVRALREFLDVVGPVAR